MLRRVVPVLSAGLLISCGSELAPGDVVEDVIPDVVEDVPGDTVPPPASFSIMTFNTGTTNNMDHAYDEDGYSNQLAEINSEYFGNNLAWLKARESLRAIVDENRPDIVVFQELFYDPDCVEICAELQGTDQYAPACDPAAAVFACGPFNASESALLTVREAVGPDYEIACAPNHPDNCIGVRKGFGTLTVTEQGVDERGAWIDGLDGMPPPSLCSKGARVATGVVGVAHGPDIAVVDVHTLAGTNVECRLQQLMQVFEDRGDGKPATFGVHNIVLGDMNIDPFTFEDDSVDYWNEHVGPGKAFHYISSGDASGPMTHPASFSKLDHVISDTMNGSCVVLGISEGTEAPVSPTSTYFDHRPVLCVVDMPE